MDELEQYIEKKKLIFSQHTFFKTLQNPKISLNDKLQFMPYLAYFIMSFGDINKYVIPFACPKDKYEKAINTHAQEDANHWHWYIEDLKQLGFDHYLSFTDTLSFLWSDSLSASRELSYEIISLVSNQNALIKYAAIEVMEATGNVTFSVLNDITKISPIKLKFCGELHLSHETGHTITEEVNVFENITIDETTKKQAIYTVDQCFDAFHKFIDQLNENLQTHLNPINVS